LERQVGADGAAKPSGDRQGQAETGAKMMRLGLLTAGGTLIAKAGLSARAFAAQGSGTTQPHDRSGPLDGPSEPGAQDKGRWQQPLQRAAAYEAVWTTRNPARRTPRPNHADRWGDQADSAPRYCLLRCGPLTPSVREATRATASSRRSSTNSA